MGSTSFKGDILVDAPIDAFIGFPLLIQICIGLFNMFLSPDDSASPSRATTYSTAPGPISVLFFLSIIWDSLQVNTRCINHA